MRNSRSNLVDIGGGCFADLKSTQKRLADLHARLPNDADRFLIIAALLLLSKLDEMVHEVGHAE